MSFVRFSGCRMPEGYRIVDLSNSRYLLIRGLDGEVIARVDDLELMLKRLTRENFIMSIYEHEEWEALDAFYSYCYRVAVNDKRGKKYMNTSPKDIYVFCMKKAADMVDSDYDQGLLDGKVLALYELGFITKEEHKAYEKLRFPYCV